jgi:hypothetical protein
LSCGGSLVDIGQGLQTILNMEKKCYMLLDLAGYIFNVTYQEQTNPTNLEIYTQETWGVAPPHLHCIKQHTRCPQCLKPPPPATHLPGAGNLVPPVNRADAALVARPNKVLVPLGEAALAVPLVDAKEVGALGTPVKADVDDVGHRADPAANVGRSAVPLAVVEVPDRVGALREATDFSSLLVRFNMSARGKDIW